MYLSNCNNSSNVSDVNLISSFYPGNNNNSTCELTAWFHSGHGFVNFNCGKMNDTFGFYPIVQNEMSLNDLFEFSSMKSGNSKKANGFTTVNSAALAVFSSAASIQKRLARERATNGGELNPAIYKASSLNKRADFLMNGGRKYLAGNFIHKALPAIRGTVMDDSPYKWQCETQYSSCIYSTLETSEKKVTKAYDYAVKVKQIAAGLAPEEKGKGLNGHYHAFDYNCIDFVRETMRRADPSLNWENNLQYTSEPTFFEKISAIAWHYFNWRKGT